MISFYVVNDPHCSDGPPLGRQPAYGEQILHKLEGVAALAEHDNCALTVVTGDFFHRKRPNHVSHALVQRLYALYTQGFEAAVIGVAGNHDMTEAGVHSLSRQPLGVLERAGAVQLLAPVEHRGKSYYYIALGGVNALFLGRPFDSERDLDPAYYALTDWEKGLASEADYVIMIVHGSVAPKKEKNPLYPRISVSQLELGAPVDLFLCGHLHDNLGVGDLPDGGTYINLGSLARTSRTPDNMNPDLPREIAKVTLTPDNIDFETVPVPNLLPPGEVFLAQEQGQDESGLREFAEQLQTSLQLEDQPIEEFLEALDAPADVKKRLRRYLEDAGL